MSTPTPIVVNASQRVTGGPWHVECSQCGSYDDTATEYPSCCGRCGTLVTRQACSGCYWQGRRKDRASGGCVHPDGPKPWPENETPPKGFPQWCPLVQEAGDES